MKQFFAGLSLGIAAASGVAVLIRPGPQPTLETSSFCRVSDLERVEASLREAIEAHSTAIARSEQAAPATISAVRDLESPSSSPTVVDHASALGVADPDEMRRVLTMLWRCSRKDSFGLVEALDASGLSPFDPRVMAMTEEAFQDVARIKSDTLEAYAKIRSDVGMPSDREIAGRFSTDQVNQWIEEIRRRVKPVEEANESRRLERLKEYRRTLAAVGG